MRRVCRLSALLALWTVAILFIVVPWGNFQDHTHWERVRWVPFLSPPFSLFDVVANVAAYLPGGYLLGRIAAKSGRVSAAVAYVVALTVLTEASQLFSHGRFPSMTDVISNGLGAWIGAWVASLRPAARPTSTASGSIHGRTAR